MFDDVARALRQIFDPRFRGVLLKSLLLTILLLAAFFAIGWWMSTLIPDLTVRVPVIGIELDWFDEAARGLAIAATLWASGFLMFPAAAIFIGLFLEDIAEAVEARWHPDLPPARRMRFWELLRQAMAFLATLLLVNILALPVYGLMLLFVITAPLAPAVFYLVNGYLLGREYFELAASRRLPAAEATRLRKRYLMRTWTAGTLMALPLSIPVLNLLVPLIGVASFTHMFHRLNNREMAASASS